MRWKIFCRRRDGGEKSSAVMDRMNKSGRSVITKLTQGVEEAREGGRETGETRAGGERPCLGCQRKDGKGIIFILFLAYL